MELWVRIILACALAIGKLGSYLGCIPVKVVSKCVTGLFWLIYRRVGGEVVAGMFDGNFIARIAVNSIFKFSLSARFAVVTISRRLAGDLKMDD